MSLCHGKKGLIVGIANERSLAYGIAKAARAEGAELWLTYQNERLKSRVEAIGKELGAQGVLPCELTQDAEVEELAQSLTSQAGTLDFIVHAVAFANRHELDGRFVDTSRQGFALAMDASVYSLVALARALEPLTRPGSSIVTLTYYGSQKVLPNYNVMGVAKAALEASVRYLAADLGPQGVRVNALSPGAVKTLSAAGIKGLRSMLQHGERVSPLRKNVAIDEVGQAALFLLSDLSRAITGEVIYVDAGYHVLGASFENE